MGRIHWLQRQVIEPYVLIAPPLIILALILVYPALRNIYLSFHTWPFTSPQEASFTGLQNYVNLLTQDHLFWQVLRFTLTFVAFTISVELLVGMGAALLLNSVGPAARLITPLVILPYMTARLAAGLVWRLLWARDYGLLAYLLSFIGLADVNWLARSGPAFFAVALPEIWRSTPFVMLILLAGLASLPTEIFEAAKVDGGSTWQIFRHITLPLLIPSLQVALIFETIFKLRVFDLIYILTGGGPGTSTLPLGILVYRTYFRYLDGGYAATLSVVLLVLGAVLTALYLRLFYREE